MKRLLVTLVLAVIATSGCGSGSGSESASTTTAVDYEAPMRECIADAHDKMRVMDEMTPRQFDLMLGMTDNLTRELAVIRSDYSRNFHTPMGKPHADRELRSALERWCSGIVFADEPPGDH